MMEAKDIALRIEQQHEMSLHVQFKGNDDPVVCSCFGCSNYLTLTEQLAGNKCTSCMHVKDSRFKHYKI